MLTPCIFIAISLWIINIYNFPHNPILSISIYYITGSIIAMSERKQLGSLLTSRIALIVMQTACSIFGILTILAHAGVPCNSDFESEGLQQV
jgi:hypothetical protein